MSATGHPTLDRLLRDAGASPDAAPSLEAWQALLALATQEITSLRESEENNRLLFDSNPLPMWVLDAETTRFVDVNLAMVATYGYSRDEFLAMHAKDVKLPEDVPEMVKGIEGVPTARIQHLGIRKHRTKRGQILEVDITIQAIVMKGRRCVLCIALDMTRSRRIEEELRQAQKMEAVGRLAGGIAHDFNNILAVIVANAEYVLGELGKTHESAEDIDEIRRAATRGAALTRQLLTFSRKQKRQPKPLALTSIVTGIEAMLHRIVGEDVTISAMAGADVGTIEADRGEVEQVLLNLVVNARDAMPSGGRILLETANATLDEIHAAEIGVAPGPYVRLSVTDTGCGMTKEVRARIFEPFFTTKDVDKGTGLGLATVFGIMKEGRGGIGVYSEPGRGTTFHMYWPRTDAVTADETTGRFEPLRGSGTVLVVEDDNQLRSILRRFLTSWGYTLLEASSGVAALEVLRQHGGPIDLLLTDLVMPGGIDGRSLGKQVTAQQPSARVVFMSGYTEHAAIKSAELGPDDHFVQKPFSAKVLCETLHRVMTERPATGRGA